MTGLAVGEIEASAMDAPQPLTRSMKSFGALLITLSCLSPSIGVFIVGSDLIRQVGSGVFLCFAAAAVLGVAMAAVYAELGSAFPVSGAEYSIYGRALGPPFAVVVLTLNLVGYSAAQALSALGVADYVRAVFPGVPRLPLALGVEALVTGLALLNIRINALVTGVFLAVELAALFLVAVLGLGHSARPLLAVALHPLAPTSGGGAAPATLIALGAATSAGVYAFNGYGAVVGLGEDMHEPAKRVAAVVFLALGAAVVAEMAPLASILTAAPDLPRLFAAEAPISAFVTARGGPGLGAAMSLGVALAIFNTMIAVALIGARLLYGTGRDRLWPAPASRLFTRLHPRWGSPWAGTLVIGAAALVLCLAPSRVLVLILGNGNVLLYAGLCAAALKGRMDGSTAHAGWRMPLFPLAPVLALLALGGVAWFDLQDPVGRQGLLASAAAGALGLLYWRLFLRGRSDWTFRLG